MASANGHTKEVDREVEVQTVPHGACGSPSATGERTSVVSGAPLIAEQFELQPAKKHGAIESNEGVCSSTTIPAAGDTHAKDTQAAATMVSTPTQQVKSKLDGTPSDTTGKGRQVPKPQGARSKRKDAKPWPPSITKSSQRQLTREKLRGRVITVTGNAAFIKPFDDLPEGYNTNKDVSFPANKAMSGYLCIQVGDEVDFTLGTKEKDRPTAFSVRLIRARQRSANLWHNYLMILKSFLTSGGVSDEMAGYEEFIFPRDGNATEVIVNILACIPIWEEIGRCEDISSVEVKQIMNVLLELNKRSSIVSENFCRVVRIIASSNLFSSQAGPIKTFIIETSHHVNDDADSVLIREFLLLVVKLIPEKARLVVTLIDPFLESDDISEETICFVYDLLKQTTSHLSESVEDMAWEELPVVPPIKELLPGPLQSKSHLQKVKVSGPYSSYEEYIDTYFRLLRADCHYALKTGVRNLLSGKLDHRDMNVYKEIALEGIHMAFGGRALSLAIKLSPDKSKLLTHPGKLMVGNLLCITIDGSFRDAIWATVANVGLLKTHKLVLVDLTTACNTLSDAEVVIALKEAGTRPLMVESPTYFKAYQPVLKALQRMEPPTDDFQDVLVKVQVPSHPSYINEHTRMHHQVMSEDSKDKGRISDQTLSLNVLEYASSPSMVMADTLDESQEAAVKHALSHKVALIEGPPGTGKTYIGARLVELIMSMTNVPSSPILVLTYKNHALDEFLKEVLPLTKSIIRVGGRSQEADLDEYSLFNASKTRRMPEDLHKQFTSYWADVDQQKGLLEGYLARLQECSKFGERAFLDYITKSALKYFLKKCEWWKTNLSPLARKGKEGDAFEKVISKKSKITKQEVNEFLDECSLSAGVNSLDPSQRGILSTLLRGALKLWLPKKEVFERIHSHADESLSENVVNDPSAEDDQDEREIAEEQRMSLAVDTGHNDRDNMDKVLKEIHFFHAKKRPAPMEYIPELSKYAKSLNVHVTAPVQAEDLWGLSQESRVRLVDQMMLRNFHMAGRELKEALAVYQRLCAMKNEIEEQHKANILQGAKIIGMTITGASIYHHYLEQVRPAIVIVEEAAEVLEPQLLAVLGDWVQHLILIGDHKQLPPQVETYTLARDYSFNVSLMERLISNNLPHATLSMQNRMRPEFAELLLDIYPTLKSNLSRVAKHIPAECIGHSMFFWHHEDTETADRSYTNEGEANRAVRLALFLIQQGYAPSSITILAAYRGQTALIRRKVREATTKYSSLFSTHKPLGQGEDPVQPDAKKGDRTTITTFTIDMYQGDENDFIIVSLVRSNPAKKIGFLKTLNRRCVAQSRACRGMYFIGNKNVFMADEHWEFIIKAMQMKNCVSSLLPLQCPKHPLKTKVDVASASDITLQAFCKLKCGEYMACGKHKCAADCQPYHEHLKCNQTIAFVHTPCGHADARACWQKETTVECRKTCQKFMACGKHPCQRKCQPEHNHSLCGVEVQFSHVICGHKGTKLCYERETEQRCDLKVTMVFPQCDHPGTKRCYEDDSDKMCKSTCLKQLPCGHCCNLSCGVPCMPENCPNCAQIREIEAKKKREAEAERRRLLQKETERELKQLEESEDIPLMIKNVRTTGDGASEYVDIEDRVKKYIQPAQNWFPCITRIEKITNIELERKWLETKLQLQDENKRSELKFHCTSDEGFAQITRDAFRLPASPGMYGTGIYFASDSSKGVEEKYTKGSNKLLLCDVLLGKSKSVESSDTGMTLEKLNHEGYDSIFAKRGTEVFYDEFVIYRPEQALARYIIHYDEIGIRTAELVQLTQLQQKAMAARKFEKFTIEQKPQFDMNDPLDVHFIVAESQFLRLMTRSTASYSIAKVDYYVNPSLVDRFEAKQTDFQSKYGTGEESQSVLAFHGTNRECNIDNIVKDNFQLKLIRRTVHGHGIYFSEFPEVSIGYDSIGKLLLCRVLPGKCSDQKLQPGCDSHRVQKDPEGRGIMLVIVNPDQILPSYVIHYRR